MKVEHELFAHQFIITGNRDEAYKKAYPKASGEALKIAARKLINRPEVREFITQELTTTRQTAATQYHEDEQKRMEQEYATMLLMRKKLREIISGETKQKKYFKFKDRIEVVEVEYSPFAVMRAIELEIKIENEWYRKYGKSKPEPKQATETQKKANKTVNKYLNDEEEIELILGPEYAAGLRAEMVRDDPRMAEEYKALGLKVLDYLPGRHDYDRMKEEHKKYIAELRELKKFTDEREDEYAATIKEIEQGNETELNNIPDPPSLPSTYPNQTETKTIPVPNQTKQREFPSCS